MLTFLESNHFALDTRAHQQPSTSLKQWIEQCGTWNI